MSFSTRVEITTIYCNNYSTAIIIKNNKNLNSYICAVFYTNSNISTCVVFFRKLCHLLKFSTETWNKENRWWPLILENKGRKNGSSNDCNILKFGEILRKDFYARKCKKMDIKKLIVVAL